MGEERVAEEVRRYPHIHNFNMKTHRDSGSGIEAYKQHDARSITADGDALQRPPAKTS